MLKKLSLSIMTFMYLFAGVAHFVKRDYFIALTPPFIPNPPVFVLLAGILYFFLALLLPLGKTRRAACYGLILLFALSLPFTFYMLASDTARGAVPRNLLIARIPFHLFLMVWAWWHSRKSLKTEGP